MATDRVIDRQTTDLAAAYLSGSISRRAFISRLLAFGLTASAAGAILAACSSSSNSSAPSSTSSSSTSSASAGGSAPASVTPSKDFKGEVRFIIGPYTDEEEAHQKVVAEGFKALYPNVSVTTKLWDWSTSATDVTLSLSEGNHDVYMFADAFYIRNATTELFADLTSRINDPAFAAEKAKYLYWDRIEQLGPKLLGVPLSFHVENGIYANLDLLEGAGFGVNFVDSWETFAEAARKLTKGTDVYGLAWGVQSYGEWYNRAVSAGGRFLTPDLKEPAINTPEVIEVTQQLVDLFKAGAVVPVGTYDLSTVRDAFAAQKIAVYSADLTVSPGLQAKNVPFRWALLPAPPGPKARVNFNDLNFLGIGAKARDVDLAWEAVKWWTNDANSGYWADESGTYPGRADAIDNGFGKKSSKQLIDAFPEFQKYGFGLELFPEFNDVEAVAEAQSARAYSGEISAAEAVANIEQNIRQTVLS